MLTICGEFARQNYTEESTRQFLSDCNFNDSKCSIFAKLYNENKLKLQIHLGNIGTHLPHIVDVKWKVDYIVKVFKKYLIINLECHLVI